MITFLIVMLVVVAGFISYGGYKIVDNKTHLKDYGYKPKELKELAWPSRQILKEFNKLPIENQPDIDVVTVVRALDAKYGGKNTVNAHFVRSYWDDVSPSWACKCDNPRKQYCKMKDYHILKNSIKELHQELADQTYALEMAKIQSNLEDGDALIARLREEKKLVSETTKELTQRSSE